MARTKQTARMSTGGKRHREEEEEESISHNKHQSPPRLGSLGPWQLTVDLVLIIAVQLPYIDAQVCRLVSRDWYHYYTDLLKRRRITRPSYLDQKDEYSLESFIYEWGSPQQSLWSFPGDYDFTFRMDRILRDDDLDFLLFLITKQLPRSSVCLNLAMACLEGAIRCLRYLLSLTPVFHNEQDELIFAACQAPTLDCLEYLLGPLQYRISGGDQVAGSAITCACERGCLDSVRLLFRHNGPNFCLANYLQVVPWQQILKEAPLPTVRFLIEDQGFTLDPGDLTDLSEWDRIALMLELGYPPNQHEAKRVLWRWPRPETYLALTHRFPLPDGVVTCDELIRWHDEIAPGQPTERLVKLFIQNHTTPDQCTTLLSHAVEKPRRFQDLYRLVLECYPTIPVPCPHVYQWAYIGADWFLAWLQEQYQSRSRSYDFTDQQWAPLVARMAHKGRLDWLRFLVRHGAPLPRAISFVTEPNLVTPSQLSSMEFIHAQLKRTMNK